MIRFLDICFSFIGCILFAPFFIFIAILIKTDSKGPVFFKQLRVGKNGVDFYLFKFRTMHINSDKLGLLTIGKRDPRVTKMGIFLRRYKIDEIPQLLNVLKGEMSFVGPRPEVRKYVEFYNPEQKEILKVRPGITDIASILYADENEILDLSDNPEMYYIQKIMPEKIRLNLLFIKNSSLKNYFKIILCTIFKIIGVRSDLTGILNEKI
jgi:lipopolysaccharide/colanic/teichoic acid biosynthesis glycosyltransferase